MSKADQTPSFEAELQQIWDRLAEADSLEHSSLDFKRPQKSDQDTMLDMADAAACFANATGGVVILGIADRQTGPDAFVGTRIDGNQLRRRIYEVTQPPLDVRVNEVEFEGVRLLAIDVAEGLDVHISRKKAPTRRFQDQCNPLSSAEISRIHDERRELDWSASPSAHTLNDIPASVEGVLRGLAETAPGETIVRLSKAPLRDLIRALGLSDANDQLNNAGSLLLVGDKDREVAVYQYRDTLGGEARVGKRWNGSLLRAYVELRAAIEVRGTSVPLNLPNGQQIQIEDFPVAAVREATANAFAHGDHREQRPVYVEHSAERMIVRSPGPLVTGVSPANIINHPPKPRFRVLAEAFRSLGLAERLGQGIDRMYREMIRSGRDVPLLSVTDSTEPETIVELSGGRSNQRLAKFIGSLPPTSQGDTDTLLIALALTRKRSVNAVTLAPQVQRSSEATEAVLRRMAADDEPIIEATQRTVRRAHPDYRLTSWAVAALGNALEYQVRSRVDSDRKVVDHVREYGHINNGTVQRLFDVDTPAARYMLQDLVGRELLVRISTQSRGTAVRYGPGPRFPERPRARKNKKDS